ncbi:hypothetical protein RJT34_30493 [Clitoria ternatea]|uniref:Uncharacterized protein n=1 Tax=Clitoria ternatea TaxID=43366 RepID=A0AAN9I212_CLITE
MPQIRFKLGADPAVTIVCFEVYRSPLFFQFGHSYKVFNESLIWRLWHVDSILDFVCLSLLILGKSPITLCFLLGSILEIVTMTCIKVVVAIHVPSSDEVEKYDILKVKGVVDGRANLHLQLQL